MPQLKLIVQGQSGEQLDNLLKRIGIAIDLEGANIIFQKKYSKDLFVSQEEE